MNRKLLLGVPILSLSILLVIIAVLSSPPSPTPHDVFTAKALQAWQGDFTSLVHMDTNCQLVNQQTMYQCIAVIPREKTLEGYQYTHPVEIPCLDKGEQVRIEKTETAYQITRLTKSQMSHSH